MCRAYVYEMDKENALETIMLNLNFHILHLTGETECGLCDTILCSEFGKLPWRKIKAVDNTETTKLNQHQ